MNRESNQDSADRRPTKPETLEDPVDPSSSPPQVVFRPPTPLVWRLAILAAICAVGLAAYAARDTIGLRGQAAAGIVFFFGIVAAMSANLRAVNWRTIGWETGPRRS